MAPASTLPPSSYTQTTTSGDSATTTILPRPSGQNSTVAMDPSHYPEPPPNDQYPHPSEAQQMARAAAAAEYDSQAQLQLMNESDVARAIKNDASMERGQAHGYVDYNGAAMSNGHGNGPPRHPPGYHPSLPANAPTPSTPQGQHILAQPHSGPLDPNADFGAQDEIHERYIQELSNRVQQIESQAQQQELRIQTMGGLPGSGYRSSIDPNDPTKMYSPEGGYVDEGDMLNEGRKRKFSEIHDPSASTPLARYGSGGDISRSGWRVGDSRIGQSQFDHPNLRNSIGLGSDQVFDNAPLKSVPKLTKPFWQRDSFSSVPQAPPGPSGLAESVSLESAPESLRAIHSSIKQSIDHIFPFIPDDPDRFIHCVQAWAPVPGEHWDNIIIWLFASVLHPRLRPERIGMKPTEKLLADQALHMKLIETIDKYATPTGFSNRSFSTNVVFLWALICLVLHSETDLVSPHGNVATNCLNHALMIGITLLEKTADPSPPSNNVDDPDSERNLTLRAWIVLCTIARWVFLANSLAVESPLINNYFKDMDVGKYGWLKNNHIKYLFNDRTLSSTNLDLHNTRVSLDFYARIFPPDSPSSAAPPALADAISSFILLLKARTSPHLDPTIILTYALNLVNIITTPPFSPDPTDDPSHNTTSSHIPLSLFSFSSFFTPHLHTLTAITLLEFRLSPLNQPTLTDDALTRIQMTLQHHVDAAASNSTRHEARVYWAEGLLRFIEFVLGVGGGGIDSTVDAAEAGRGGEEEGEGEGGEVRVDFRALVGKGYKRVVAECLGTVAAGGEGEGR
ncbi:MAG: hypothetical protein Q9227_002256 [Pyrenula ochraceoflavens]